MNVNTFDLNLLRVFAALHREGNVSRAARAIGLSQPAMSNALFRLRRACGDPLFVRTREGMAPTVLAASLAGPVRQALDILEASLGRPFDFDPTRSDRTFRLLMSDVGELVVLPRLVRALEKQAPDVKIDALRIAHEEYPHALENGQADLAIGNLRFLKTAFYQQRLFNDRYFCVVRAGHPSPDSGLSLEDYLAARHISAASGNADLLVEAALARKRVHRRVDLRVTHYHVAAAVVAGTDLIATLPEHAIPVSKRLRVLPLPFRIASADVRQFWHRRYNDDPANRWLRALIAGLSLDDDPSMAPF